MDEKFGIFPAEGELDSEEIDTVNHIVNYILKKLKEKQE
jgi:acyl carrier protein